MRRYDHDIPPCVISTPVVMMTYAQLGQLGVVNYINHIQFFISPLVTPPFGELLGICRLLLYLNQIQDLEHTETVKLAGGFILVKQN